MAAATQVDTVNITVNDIELAVPKGEIIVESVKRLGLEIPIFCYHSRLKPVGMCRMCLVEVGFKQADGTVRKMPKPQAACTLPASEGMAIYTDSAMVHHDRKGVLEFLLINHPLDCPICDRGGECPLQNNTLFYGPSTSRFVEIKRHLPKAFPLSQYVTLDLERCIQCGRCVRFTEEISGDSELAFRFRGASMQPSTFELRDFGSKFSGNVIEICPVGALTSAKYRFRARPWDLETRPSICTLCSNGCNIWFDYRVGRLMRVNGRTNEAVNEEWTCDKGKFGHEFYNSEKRLTKPLIREGDSLGETGWAAVYSSVIRAFTGAEGAVAALVGGESSNEDLFMLQHLFREQFASDNMDHRWTKHLQKPEQRLEEVLGVPQVQTKFASLEDRTNILVFGTSLADEQPMVFLRVRKAWFKEGAKVVVASDKPTDADSFAAVILRYKPGTEGIVAAGLMNIISQGGTLATGLMSLPLKDFTPEHVETATGVPAAKLKEAAALVSGSTIVCSESLTNSDQGQNALVTLASLAKATGGEFNLYGLRANDAGADMLGVVPRAGGKNTHEILQGCVDGTIKALWLVNVDPFERHADRALVEKALETVPFLAVQSYIENEATGYASVVLPQTAPAEAEGTFTNAEKRVQRIRHILDPKGEAKPGWKIFSEIIVRLKPATPLFNAGEVMDQIIAANPEFAGANYKSLSEEGHVVDAGRQS